ncbi:MAG: ATP-binding cassette domain-containing protein [Vicinamibacteria bacterium]
MSLALGAGRTLGLVGSNGAGKSTLLNVIGGLVRPDAGAMRLGGEPYAPRDPREAERRGVAFVHQELNLFPNLSVGENLFLGRLPRRRGLVDRRALGEGSRRWLEAVGLAVPGGSARAAVRGRARQGRDRARPLARRPAARARRADDLAQRARDAEAVRASWRGCAGRA